MLQGIHPLLRGNLLHALDALGHGDVLVIADAYFPAHRLAPGKVVDLPGQSVPEVLSAILTVFPVDAVDPCALMGNPQGSGEVEDAIVAELQTGQVVESVERHAFYDLAARAGCIVLAGETRPYGNVALLKGIPTPFAPGP